MEEIAGVQIARQRQGKSTIAFRLAIDVFRGEPFLGRYRTQQAPVLCADYENRSYRLKERGLDVAQNRSTDDVLSIIEHYEGGWTAFNLNVEAS
jgi:hypothetical protein